MPARHAGDLFVRLESRLYHQQKRKTAAPMREREIRATRRCVMQEYRETHQVPEAFVETPGRTARSGADSSLSADPPDSRTAFAA